MKSWTRRDLIRTMGAVGAAAAVRPNPAAAFAPPATPPAEAAPSWGETGRSRRALRILFIGGTGFIGPHMVRRAQARGHTVSLFNRGRTNAHLFPDVEKFIGDRDGGLDVLRGHSWDAVIDTSGYVPRVVRESAELLRDIVDRYLFISTGDVYADFEKIGLDEDYTLDTIEDPTSEDPGRFYGPLKVLCEKAVRETYPDSFTILRPGWIIGAGDYNSISPYWPMRIHTGGEVLAPGDPTDPVQLIDPQDLAAFVIKLLEDDINGIYNTVGPASPLTMAELLYGMRAVTDTDVRFTWVPADFLQEMNVAAMTDMPIWFPPRDDYPTPAPFEPGAKGFHRMSGARAIAAGLTFRPLAETARDIIDEYLSRGEDWASTQRRFGLSLEREAEVLAAWTGRQG
jgi:nucleoside-diphosphate-sugar epimerase